MKAGRIEDGFKYMEKAAECAIIHDKLPEKVYSKCILFSCHPYDRKWEAKPYIELKKELLSDFETEDEFYVDIRERKEYGQIMEMLD